MNKALNIFIIVGLLVILLVVAVMGYEYLTQDRKPDNLATETTGAEPQPAPDFTVYDPDGNAHRLSDFKGKPVVLNFWASWCPPCKAELPDFQAEFDAQGEHVHFLFINLTDGKNETQDSATSFINSMGYTFPVYFDLDGDAVNAFGIRAIPTTYFIDAEGNLVAKAVGAINIAALRQYIRMIAPET